MSSSISFSLTFFLPTRMLSSIVICFLLHSISQSMVVNSFPQGAPAEVCESLSPKHGHKANSQNLKLSPFRLIQYGQRYASNDFIPVEIIARDDLNSDEEPVLKGFIVQAFDPETFEYLGHFIYGEGLNLMPECSAVTHENSKDKTSVSLIWVAPKARWGDVLFRATIVINKSIFFENMLAEVAPHPHHDFESQSDNNFHNNQINQNIM